MANARVALRGGQLRPFTIERTFFRSAQTSLTVCDQL
jgi:hypothetical protein